MPKRLYLFVFRDSGIVSAFGTKKKKNKKQKTESVFLLLQGAFSTLLRLYREDVLMFHTVINLCVNTNLSPPLLLERVTQQHHGNMIVVPGSALNQWAEQADGNYMSWITS